MKLAPRVPSIGSQSQSFTPAATSVVKLAPQSVAQPLVAARVQTLVGQTQET